MADKPLPTPMQTRFSDVCGTIDELKRVIHEEPDLAASDNAQLLRAIDEAIFMERRMVERLREYEQFRDELVAHVATLETIESPAHQDATADADALRALLNHGQSLTAEERARAAETAEAIRAVAQNLENTLYRYKDLALAVGRTYRTMQGQRRWVLDQADIEQAAALPGEPAWAHWLPPSPHRERILRYLRAGRAHLIEHDNSAGGDGVPPSIQFEDGGMMSLPVVRWSEEVGNFYPEGQQPHPHGLQYRDGSG